MKYIIAIMLFLIGVLAGYIIDVNVTASVIEQCQQAENFNACINK